MPFIISWICVALFNVSMISGLIVAFHYKPSLAYESVQQLTFLIPYGDLFRQLHYFSSEAFLVFTFLHVGIELSKSKVTISSYSWNCSILALIAMFMLMFTGYVLKADLSGFSAGEVALSMIKQTPLLKDFLPLLEDNVLFEWKFYVWHILFLPILLIYVLLVHVKTFKTKYFIIGFGISIVCMMVLTMPADIIFGSNMSLHVKGPWFFRGAENLLMLGFPPVFIEMVLVLPFTFLVLYFYKQDYQKMLSYLLLTWTGIYALLSFI